MRAWGTGTRRSASSSAPGGRDSSTAPARPASTKNGVAVMPAQHRASTSGGRTSSIIPWGISSWPSWPNSPSAARRAMNDWAT